MITYGWEHFERDAILDVVDEALFSRVALINIVLEQVVVRIPTGKFVSIV